MNRIGVVEIISAVDENNLTVKVLPGAHIPHEIKGGDITLRGIIIGPDGASQFDCKD